jgi:hypothetical protein
MSFEYRERKLSTGPFANEMKTLAAILQPAFPFSIPSRDAIHEDTFSMPEDGEFSGFVTAKLCLVFNKPSAISALDTASGTDLKTTMRMLRPPSHRQLLDSSMDEIDDDFGA